MVILSTRMPMRTAQVPLMKIDLPDGWHALIRGNDAPIGATTNPVMATIPADRAHRLFAAFLADAAKLPGYAVLKYSPAGEVVRVSASDSPAGPYLIFKRSRPPRGWRRLFPWGYSRERRGLETALMVLDNGIPTATPVALLKHRVPGESWLVLEFLDGAVDLVQALSPTLPGFPPLTASERRRLAQSLAQLFANLERSGLSHRDLKASNVMVQFKRPSDRTPKIYIIDLDGFRRQGFIPRSRWKPIARMAASLRYERLLCRSDACRFLKSYIELRKVPVDWKTCFRTLDVESRNYLRRASQRKSNKIDGFVGD